MRFRFGASSEYRLRTTHEDIQRVLRLALSWGVIDFVVVDGHRGKARQNEYFNARPQRSKKQWPHGKHNSFPSDAVDVAPWVDGDIPWTDTRQWYVLDGVIMAAAAQLGVELRAGYDWDGDTELSDQQWNDLGHFERRLA